MKVESTLPREFLEAHEPMIVDWLRGGAMQSRKQALRVSLCMEKTSSFDPYTSPSDMSVPARLSDNVVVTVVSEFKNGGPGQWLLVRASSIYDDHQIARWCAMNPATFMTRSRSIQEMYDGRDRQASAASHGGSGGASGGTYAGAITGRSPRAGFSTISPYPLLSPGVDPFDPAAFDKAAYDAWMELVMKYMMMATVGEPEPLRTSGVVAGEFLAVRAWAPVVLERNTTPMYIDVTMDNGAMFRGPASMSNQIQAVGPVGTLASLYVRDHVWKPGETVHGSLSDDGHSKGVHGYRMNCLESSELMTEYVRKYIRGSYPHVLDELDVPFVIIGTVQLWGDVVEHEYGWRGEYARIRSLDSVFPSTSAEGKRYLTEARKLYGTNKEERR